MSGGWVGVEVPATSANLGPGFDCIGLALDLVDTVHARIAATTVVHLNPPDADVPTDGTNLVARAVLRGLDAWGGPTTGVELRCTNRIPHARGLGSSAAAIVAGLGLARELLDDPDAVPDLALLELATQMEGHPDNVAPAIWGGAVLSYVDAAGAHAVPLPVADIEPRTWVPPTRASTAAARAALPAEVPFAAAAFNASRAALLTIALASPRLLFAATEDRLHQQPRAAVMPQSAALIGELRERGVPAVLSGAGPTVLSFGPVPEPLAQAYRDRGWDVATRRVPLSGLRIVNPA